MAREKRRTISMRPDTAEHFDRLKEVISCHQPDLPRLSDPEVVHVAVRLALDFLDNAEGLGLEDWLLIDADVSDFSDIEADIEAHRVFMLMHEMEAIGIRPETESDGK